MIILTHSDLLIDSGQDSHDSDQDSDRSEKSGSGIFVVFPEDEDTVSDMESDEEALSDISGEQPGFHTESDMGDDSMDACTIQLPETLKDLQKALLGDYSLPQCPPKPQEHVLTASQRLTLEHYIAWKKSNGTVSAYKLHGQVLQKESGKEILSLHSARKLAANLTDFKPLKADICPKSCIAFTGEFEDLEFCPFVRDGVKCGEARYKKATISSRGSTPRAQMMCLPIMATIKAMFANAETAQQLRHRDTCLQQALHAVATAHKTYSDFGDSEVHMHHRQHMNLFQDQRDVAFAL